MDIRWPFSSSHISATVNCRWIGWANGDRTDEVWLCLLLFDEKGIRLALNALRHSTVNIRLVPDLF